MQSQPIYRHFEAIYTFLGNSRVPIAGLYGQKKAKMAVSVAIEAKLEVEIWQRPKKSTF